MAMGKARKRKTKVRKKTATRKKSTSKKKAVRRKSTRTAEAAAPRAAQPKPKPQADDIDDERAAVIECVKGAIGTHGICSRGTSKIGSHAIRNRTAGSCEAEKLTNPNLATTKLKPQMTGVTLARTMSRILISLTSA